MTWWINTVMRKPDGTRHCFPLGLRRHVFLNRVCLSEPMTLGYPEWLPAVDAIVTSIKDVNPMKAFHWLLCLCLMMGAVGCTAESDTPETESAVDVIEGTEVDPAALLVDEPEAETTEEPAETPEGEEATEGEEAAEAPAEESDN